MKVTEVDVSKLSDEELEKLLSDVDEGDLKESTAGTEYEETGFGCTDFQPVAETTEADENSSVDEDEAIIDGGEEVVEDVVKEPKEPEEPKKADTKVDEDRERLYAKIRELEEKVQGIDSATQLRPEQQATENGANKMNPEQFFENPDQAIEQKLLEIEARKIAAHEKAVREFNRRTEETKTIVLKQVPEFETYVNDMADYLKTRGMGDETVLNEFKKNPYAAQNVPALIMLADIAKSKHRSKKPAKVTQPSPSVIRPGKVKPETGSKVIVTAESIKNLSDEQLNSIIEKGRL